MSWVRLLLGRVLGAAGVLLALSVLVFAATDVLPGDVVARLAGPTATAGERAGIRTELGLDRPVAVRYRDWATDTLRGDLGTSFVGGRPVAEVLAARLPASALLAALSLVLATAVAVAAGLSAGMRPGSATDRLVSTVARVVVGVPEFLAATVLLLVLATWAGWFPRVSLVPLGSSPVADPRVLVLPVLSLSLTAAAVGVRMVRASVVDVVTTPYVDAARLAGVRGWRLGLRHVLPGAVAPLVQVVAVTAVGSLGGAVVVETLFDYPGIGRELQQAVLNRDVPLVQGTVLALSAAGLVVLLVGDVVARVLDPRAGSSR
ncbi:ABC transporter permease [Kineococcus sp. TBRC 1896]|uniref:ABC transporter permease n=1 Tax=Kineococcus mangrovi TaxID=1660183 RepID=A0ABV4I081_9ACTN